VKRNIEPRNINLTYEQVRELMGDSPIRNVREGNTITWQCNYVDPETWKTCPYTFDEGVYFDADTAPWPHAMIDHIWREGHMQFTADTNGPVTYQPIYQRMVPWYWRSIAFLSMGFAVGMFGALIWQAVTR
jgi:hypothetical protein